MSRALDDLIPPMRLKAFELIARAAEQGIPLFIVDTLRTQAEQAINVAKKVSWTMNSRHLTGRAIDVVPYELYTAAPGGDKLSWNVKDPRWPILGAIGEGLGLEWGGSR